MPSNSSVSSFELVPPAAGSTRIALATPLPSIVAGPAISTGSEIAGRSPVSAIVPSPSVKVIVSRPASEAFDARIASRSVQWATLQVPSDVSPALLTTSPPSSLLVIVTVCADGAPSVLPDGFESATVKVCGFSATLSSISGTANVLSDSPAAKLRVPLVAV
jgi:hypothetical protein